MQNMVLVAFLATTALLAWPSEESLQAGQKTRFVTMGTGGVTGKDISSSKEIALGLGHLFALDHQESGMNPVAGKMVCATGTTRLGNLALMVRKDQVFSTGVDINDILSQ